jgi:hypothetical protein
MTLSMGEDPQHVDENEHVNNDEFLEVNDIPWGGMLNWFKLKGGKWLLLKQFCLSAKRITKGREMMRKKILRIKNGGNGGMKRTIMGSPDHQKADYDVYLPT